MMNSGVQEERFLGRLKAFMRIIYEPKLHFIFAGFWFLSLQGHFVLHADQSPPWVLSIASLVGILTLFLVMFFLRAVDEVKDLEYDKKYNPERPLVSGAVTMSDIVRYWFLAFLIIPVINLGLSAWLALVEVRAMAAFNEPQYDV